MCEIHPTKVFIPCCTFVLRLLSRSHSPPLFLFLFLYLYNQHSLKILPAHMAVHFESYILLENKILPMISLLKRSGFA